MNRVERPPARRARDAALVVGGVLVLLFALLGLASAAKFVGDNVSGHKSPTPTAVVGSGSSTANQDIARAQAQATAIVKSAQSAGSSIIKSSTDKAKKQAKSIVSSAKHQTPSSTGSSNTAVPVGPNGYQPSLSNATPVPAPGSASPPSAKYLNSVPKSWQVVAYNATFGKGPGSAGGVSVINRGTMPLSGTVTVDYYGPKGKVGSATTSFTALAPGSSAVLPLNGPRYLPNGRYQIRVSNIH